MNTATNIEHATTLLKEIAPRVDRTIRNLRDALAGWPTSSAGSGDPPTSTPTVSISSSTERTALAPDAARRDLDRINTAIRRLERDLSTVAAIVMSWDYPTGNEYDPLVNRPTATPSAGGAPLPCCRVCIKIQKVEPEHRAGLCRWCYTFRSAEGFDPPPELLQTRHDGRRVTMPMVERARTEHGPKRKRRKRGKATAK